MKATLESRKSVRLNWFTQNNVPFSAKRELDFSYTLGNVQYNEISHTVYLHYVFTNLENPIPDTKIIIFDGGLPQSYLHTIGSVGKKISTDKIVDGDLTVMDRIVKVDQGEDKITTKPVPPFESHLYKEIQIHEREDRVKRKITIKNESDQPIKDLEVTFIENKEVNFSESIPTPEKVDAPEYSWMITIPGGSTASIELNVVSHQKNTYKIEKPHKNTEDSPGFRQI